MPFRIERNDITKVHTEAIVNTANPLPTYGTGTDTAVYEAAGMAQLLVIMAFQKKQPLILHWMKSANFFLKMKWILFLLCMTKNPFRFRVKFLMAFRAL